MILTRRAALLGLGSAISLGRASLAVASAATDRRFVVVLLRGALDGLAAVVPYGDRALAVSNWAPASFAAPPPELYARIAALNRSDAITGPAIAAGLRERGFSTEVLGEVLGAAPGRREKFAFPALAGAAGRMLGAADGPRIAALEIGGWDTHSDQKGRLALPLRQLDAGLMALRDGLGEAWRQTAVLVMTEFGRTVRMNGTRGTDHGTGTAAFVLGGAVQGGRVQADWPGLAESRLLDRRDLQPTTDMRAVAKGVLAQLFASAPPRSPRCSPAASASRRCAGSCGPEPLPVSLASR